MIEFDMKPDVVGMGRIIVDGRFYGLPAEAVMMLRRAYVMCQWTWPESMNLKLDD